MCGEQWPVAWLSNLFMVFSMMPSLPARAVFSVLDAV
jgi:hypothetical protein